MGEWEMAGRQTDVLRGKEWNMKKQLYIKIQGREGMVRFGEKKIKIGLDKKPILWSIDGVVKNIKAIQVDIQGATFSETRQVIATVNTLAWVLDIKVNGKKQMNATYSAEPNITVAKPIR